MRTNGAWGYCSFNCAAVAVSYKSVSSTKMALKRFMSAWGGGGVDGWGREVLMYSHVRM